MSEHRETNQRSVPGRWLRDCATGEQTRGAHLTVTTPSFPSAASDSLRQFIDHQDAAHPSRLCSLVAARMSLLALLPCWLQRVLVCHWLHALTDSGVSLPCPHFQSGVNVPFGRPMGCETAPTPSEQ